MVDPGSNKVFSFQGKASFYYTGLFPIMSFSFITRGLWGPGILAGFYSFYGWKTPSLVNSIMKMKEILAVTAIITISI